MMRALLVTAVSLWAPLAAAQRIAVVASDQPAFAEAARAAVEALAPDAQLVRADDAAKGAIAAAEITIAVGPLADRLVASVGTTKRGVTCLAPRSNGGALLVPLRASDADVLSLVKAAAPAARTLALFPATPDDVAPAKAAARAAGLTLLTPNPGEPFAAALDRLVGAADILWVQDVGVLPAGAAALIIKRASDGNKSVIGPNRSTVVQGALFALVPDPVAQGRAAADVARRLLKGEDVATVESPAGRILLNGALARTRGLKLPAAMARRAENVE